jgi:hypothetical protein
MGESPSLPWPLGQRDLTLLVNGVTWDDVVHSAQVRTDVALAGIDHLEKHEQSNYQEDVVDEA